MMIEFGITEDNEFVILIMKDNYSSVPGWVLDWAGDNIAGKYKYNGRFNANEDFKQYIPTDKIKHFLEQLVVELKANTTELEYTTDYVSAFPHGGVKIGSYFQLDAAIPLIEKLLSNKEVTKEQFEAFENKMSSLKVENHFCELETEEGCTKFFMIEHVKQFKEDKSSWFTFFLKSTTIKEDTSLTDILSNGKNHNQRCRKVLVNLGWLQSDGSLSANAPEPVRDNYPASNFPDNQ